MKLNMKILDSSFKHIQGLEEGVNSIDLKMEVLREEHFAFQLLIRADRPFFCTLGKNRDLHWRGLGDRIRLDIPGFEDLLELSFLGYVTGDDGSLVGDPILRHKSLYLEGWQAVWVQGKIPEGFALKKARARVCAYYDSGFQRF